MSSEELFCPQHGPYPASLGACPYCARQPGQLPQAPRPLDEDELPTQAFEGPPGALEGYGGDETIAPRRAGEHYGGDEEATMMPEHQRRAGILDEDEMDVTVLEREDTTLMGWLVVKTSPHMRRGHFIKIKPGAIWGRDPRKANIVVDDEKISGLHARIQVKESQFVVIDLGSSNGTWVNGEEITAPRPLVQDDEIKMGSTVFVLKTL